MAYDSTLISRGVVATSGAGTRALALLFALAVTGVPRLGSTQTLPGAPTTGETGHDDRPVTGPPPEAPPPEAPPPAAPPPEAPPRLSASALDARFAYGVVVAAGQRQPLEAATVLVGEQTAITDSQGAFALAVGRQADATVIADGFVTRVVTLRAGQRTVIELRPVGGGETIVVTGRAPEQVKPVSYSLATDEVRYLPGAGGDVLRALQALPGVARIPFNFGGLVLRGMSPRDSLVFLDGIEVPLAFHFGGLVSFYPTALLDEVKLTPSGYDAGYGRAQGGIVELSTREARTDRYRVGGEIGLLHSAVYAEGPAPKRGGFTAGIRRSYLDAILRPMVTNDTALPSYLDGQVRMAWGDPKGRGRIIAMLFGSVDRVANDQFAITSTFVRAATAFRKQRAGYTFNAVASTGANLLRFASSEGSEPAFSRPLYVAALRGDMVRDHAWGHWRVGADLSANYLTATQFQARSETDTLTQTLGSKLAWLDSGAWAEVRYRWRNGLSLKPGLRVDAFGGSGEVVVDPRLNATWSLPHGITLRHALGRYHQPPTGADLDRNDGNPDLKSSYANQASLGVDAQLPHGVLVSATAYGAYVRQLATLEPRGNDDVADDRFGGLSVIFAELLEKQLGASQFRSNRGSGRTYGAELNIKYSSKRWFAMFGYTLARSERADSPALRKPDEALWHPYALDQRHRLSMVASHVLGAWRLGARLAVVSGNPYAPLRAVNHDENGLPVVERTPYGGRLPMFVSLDLRADRSWEQCWGKVNLFFDVQNATMHTNIEAIDYDSDGKPQYTRGLPILPLIGVEFIPNP